MKEKIEECSDCFNFFILTYLLIQLSERWVVIMKKGGEHGSTCLTGITCFDDDKGGQAKIT